MSRTRGSARGGSTLHVVLGESAQSHSLREILDRAGFDVVGQASSPGDLLRLLAVSEPDVIVLDAEVSATAALSVRDLAPMAGIVVVWPAAVSSSVADRQVTPARAAFDLPEAVRRAKRPQEARVAVLAAVPAMTEPAEVVYLHPRPRARRRIREHTFGLVAASFIIAVAALGFVRTAVDDGNTRADSVQVPRAEPSQTPGDGNGENQEPQEPQEPPSVSKREPIGPVALLSHVASASKAQGPTDEPNIPPNDGGPGGDGPDDGDDPTEEPTGHHGGDFNGYDNPREHLVGSHRRDTSTNSGHQPDWQDDDGAGHAVHGADGKSG